MTKKKILDAKETAWPFFYYGSVVVMLWCYLYGILVFSGSIKGIQSDSLVMKDTKDTITYEDWQQRAVDEKTELDDRIAKLHAFVNDTGKFGSVPPEEQQRLKNQLSAMEQYSAILAERIDNFH